MQDSADIPLYLFAKEPVAGRVKTRLMPQLGAEGCAALAQQMLADSVQQMVSCWPGERVLCVTPSVDAPGFVDLAKKNDCRIALQNGDDLGERMLNAIDEGVERAGAAMVLGCDVPYLPCEVLQQSWQSMRQGQNVIGPADDGGFYLLGLQNADRVLFEDVAWGGSQVLTKVLQNARSANIDFALLTKLRDIDLWDDLVWLADHDKRYLEFVTNVERQI